MAVNTFLFIIYIHIYILNKVEIINHKINYLWLKLNWVFEEGNWTYPLISYCFELRQNDISSPESPNYHCLNTIPISSGSREVLCKCSKMGDSSYVDIHIFIQPSHPQESRTSFYVLFSERNDATEITQNCVTTIFSINNDLCNNTLSIKDVYSTVMCI